MNTIKVPYEVISKAERIPFYHFIFDDFKLQIEGWLDGLLLEVKFNNDGIANYEAGDELPLLTYSVFNNQRYFATYVLFVDSLNVFEGRLYEYHSGELKDIDVRIIEMVHAFTSNILFSMSYIMNYPRERKQTRVSSHKYSREYRLSTKQNRIYLFSDILKYVSDTYVPEGQHHNIQCPCWEVRGHYRHYKNGHVVFIRSYKKGKQKDTAQPIGKEYIAGQRKVVVT